MILTDFLSPIAASLLEEFEEAHEQTYFKQMPVHGEFNGVPDLKGVQLAIVGVLEDRGSVNNTGAEGAADAVREYLYPLFCGKWNVKMVDLGNIYPGESLQDSYVALKEVCYQLYKKQIIPIIIGGGQDLTYAAYRAYDRMEQTVNLVSIDARLDLGRQDEPLNASNYLSHVVLQKPYILFNYANLGHQTYFANQEELDLMERMYFDINRLGNIRHQVHHAEPVLRDADLVSFDLSAVRQSDAPGNSFHSPNGFSGEEACALARYAGISDKLSCFGLFEYNPLKDTDGRTAHLLAQMIWYFTEGVSQRKGDYPFTAKEAYQKFTVLINEGEHELIFYRSHLSDRWWIEIPGNTGSSQLSRPKLVPCSFEDYQEALKNEVPFRWWQAVKKSI
jgi:formiminoglutamase